jgi:hypothetical protein
MMKRIRIQSRIAWFVSAIVILLQMSPAVAGGAPGVGPEMTQSSQVPGMLVSAKDKAGDKHGKSIEVTFTKWITTYPLMAGFTGGDAVGDYAGEVFQRQVSQDGRIVRLEAIYEVRAGNRSFTALIRGGSNSEGNAILDGVVLAGWRTGAQVHVTFKTIAPCQYGTQNVCFQGTITVGDSED